MDISEPLNFVYDPEGQVIYDRHPDQAPGEKGLLMAVLEHCDFNTPEEADRAGFLLASSSKLLTALETLTGAADGDIYTDAPECAGSVEAVQAALIEARAAISQAKGGGAADVTQFWLYEIKAGDEINNFDLFVVASDPGQAAGLWGTFYENPESHPETVRQVAPMPGPGRVIYWENLPKFTFTGPDEYVAG